MFLKTSEVSIWESSVLNLYCVFLYLIFFMLLVTNNKNKNMNSLARGCILHFLNNSLQDTLFLIPGET